MSASTLTAAMNVTGRRICPALPCPPAVSSHHHTAVKARTLLGARHDRDSGSTRAVRAMVSYAPRNSGRFNLLDLITAAGLSAEEIHEFGRLQRKRIRRYRRPNR